jgi:rare lipoprotein A
VLLYASGHKKLQVKAPVVPGRPVSVSSSDLEGIASYYAEPYHGRRTANGEVFDTYQAMTAAHRTLPFNTMVRVTNNTNGREVDVRINDRGPFIDGRVIDLSLRAAREIDLVRPGIAPVTLKILEVKAVEKPPAFAVQVGAFENESAAEDLKQQLEKKYSGVVVQTVTLAKTMYRVRIGQPDAEAANRVAAELRRQDYDPFVVRLN